MPTLIKIKIIVYQIININHSNDKHIILHKTQFK